MVDHMFFPDNIYSVAIQRNILEEDFLGKVYEGLQQANLCYIFIQGKRLEDRFVVVNNSNVHLMIRVVNIVFNHNKVRR